MNLAIRIGKGEDAEIYHEWAEARVELGLNTVASTFSFRAMINETNSKLFAPGRFIECEVIMMEATEDGVVNKGSIEPLITGYIVSSATSIQKTPELSEIKGMSRPGVLVTTNMPLSLYPLQYNDTSLETISRRICNEFDLELYVHDGAKEDAAKKYSYVACQPTESIKNFLSRIAKERGITVAHDNQGRLYLYKIVNVTEATSEIKEDGYIVRMSIAPNDQALHSSCTAISDNEELKPDEGKIVQLRDLNTATVKSPFIKNILLPKTIVVKSEEKEDIGPRKLRRRAEAELAEEARSFPVNIRIEGWDIVKRQVRAGFYLVVEAPSIFVKRTKMLIESQTFEKDAKGVKYMNLSCILPCVYTGKLPKLSPFNEKVKQKFENIYDELDASYYDGDQELLS